VRSALPFHAVSGIPATVSPNDKPLVILSGSIKTPPLSSAARIEAGFWDRKD
jgi:hypothetical protein